MRTMALKCISACITTYLQRTTPEARGRELPLLVRQPLALTLGLLRKNVLHTSEQRVRRGSIRRPARTCIWRTLMHSIMPVSSKMRS